MHLQLVPDSTQELLQANERLSAEVDEKIEVLQKVEYAEIKYQHAQKMEALGTLVGGIAHDFNNMLSGITANFFLIQRQVTHADVSERLEKIGGLTMHAACNGLEAVAIYKKRQAQIALVIMDVIMPVLGGAGVGERIHKLNLQARLMGKGQA